jgi:FkbH-like protein
VLVADDDRDGPDAAIINAALRERLAGLPGVSIVGLAELARGLGSAYRDERLLRLAASDLTDRASIEIARELAFRSIPVATRPRLKLVAVDVDNTLVDGVIGEDGVIGVRIGPHRAAMARTLARIAEAGVLVALVSRNERADVEALLEQRPDLALSRSALFAVEAGWRPKAEALEDIVTRARVGMDAVLFVDDNPGELAAIAAAHPAVHVLSAADAVVAASALGRYPGLHGYPASREDSLRAGDLQAAAIRDRARTSATSEADYLRSLQIEVELAVDDPDDLPRAIELSGKTNQFNTALRRFSAAELAERLGSHQSRIVTASLRDRLSDSGVIASIVATAADGVLDIEEVCISCRALGRGIESRIVAEAVRAAASALGTHRLRFAYAPGPRNEPARAWLEDALGHDPGSHPVLDMAALDAPLGSGTAIEIRWRSD